jgi:hypothetical protein
MRIVPRANLRDTNDARTLDLAGEAGPGAHGREACSIAPPGPTRRLELQVREASVECRLDRPPAMQELSSSGANVVAADPAGELR